MTAADMKLLALAALGAACGIGVGYYMFDSTSKAWPTLGIIIVLVFRRGRNYFQ